ncbi:MAG: CDGSH iron-sulfur domain-containing protein [Proteobacteria bacterium]|nr:CDGSH iron-sulfur domain-containing protein [Pseudomonadota bacterium]
MSEKPPVQPGTVPAPDSFSIKVSKDGPYIVHGKPPLGTKFIVRNAAGHSWSYEPGQTFEVSEPMALCRCGRTGNAPFCDGSHKAADVELTETASFAPLLENSVAIQGPTLTLTDNEAYCAYGRFCDAGARIWNQVSEGGEESDRLTARMAQHCPAGRLLVFDNATGVPVETEVAPDIGLIEDPAIHASGPIMVSGGIRVESADGRSYEVRTRQALCRCGQSSNKPFCDGTHASMKFQDGLEPRRR